MGLTNQQSMGSMDKAAMAPSAVGGDDYVECNNTGEVVRNKGKWHCQKEEFFDRIGIFLPCIYRNGCL